jgi:hypothetical protein
MLSSLIVLATAASTVVASNSDPVYTWDFSAASTMEHKVLGAMANSRFGSSLSMDDHFLVSGSPNYVSNYVKTGAAFVFYRDSLNTGDWDIEAILTPDDGSAGDMYGCSVAVFDKYIIVGAMYNGALAYRSGAAYGYRRVTYWDDSTTTYRTEWELLTKMAPENLKAQDYFGNAVAMYNNITAIAAYGRDDMATLSGSVYIYTLYQDETGYQDFIYDELLYASDGARYDWFGTSLSLYGNYLAVGAPGVDYNGKAHSGGAYIFARVPNAEEEDGYEWIELEKIVSSAGNSGDHMGTSIALSYDTVIIGAENAKSPKGVSEAGCVYVFRVNNAKYSDGIGYWKYAETISSPDPTHYGHFGHALSIYGDAIAIGSYNSSGYGAVFLYHDVIRQSVTRKDVESYELTFTRTPSDFYIGGEFGASAILYKNQLVVGSPGALYNSDNYGAIYTYTSTSTVDVYTVAIQSSSEETAGYLTYPTMILLFIAFVITLLLVYAKYGDDIMKAYGMNSGRRRVSNEETDDDVSGHSEIGLVESNHSERFTYSSRNSGNRRF